MFFLQLSGIPGSGKSTLALEISKRVNVVIIDHDVTKSALMRAGIEESAAGKTAYEVDYTYVNYYLACGHNVIMDSPCFYDIQLERSVEAAERNNAKYKYVECYLNDKQIIDERLSARERKISQLELLTQEAFAIWMDNMKKPKSNYIIVDTSKPIGTYLQTVIDYLLSD